VRTPTPPEPRSSASGRLASDLSDGDAAFLDALDDLDLAPVVSRNANDAELAAAFDSLSTTLHDTPRRASSADADLAADLDSIDFGIDERAAPAAPRPRIRPEDIELSAAERTRAAGHKSVSPRPAPRPRPADDDDATTIPMPRRSTAPARKQSTSDLNPWLIPALSAALVLLLLLLGFVIVMGNRVTIAVTAPVRSENVVPIAALPLALTSPGMGESTTAIQAEALASDVAFSADGVVTQGTLAPSGTANGIVTILSLNNQPITLPAGTEFVAVQPNGQEVPFISAADVVVPPATTQDTGAQVVTSRGQVDLAVTARSAGSASNVDANTIRRMILPDGQSFTVDAGALIVRHNALIGGTEAEVFIVNERDLQPALAAALTGLDAEARRQISGLASARGLVLEETTITPRRSDLEQLQGFESFVSPPIGETVSPEQATFSVTTQARYAALATPAGSSLQSQIEQVFAEQLRQAGLLTPGDCRAPFISGWYWNGATLTVDGTIAPDPNCGAELDAAAYNQVRNAVRGKSRAEAIVALDALVAQGLIGGYTLPNVDRMPGWNWQIRVES
jgi:hypothetical protein